MFDLILGSSESEKVSKINMPQPMKMRLWKKAVGGIVKSHHARGICKIWMCCSFQSPKAHTCRFAKSRFK